MRTRRILSILAIGTMTAAFSAATVGGASAGSSWTKFDPGTGIHEVTYTTSSTVYTSMMDRSGSGIVHQYIAPGALGGAHGSYYQFKPLTTTGLATTPFKQSCDQQGQVVGYFPRVWTYSSANYTPTDVLKPYFPIDGLNYWVCQYELSNYATGDIHYNVGDSLDRHVTFDVQMPAPGFAGGGWMTYADGTTTYTITVDAVYINGTMATFSGPYPAGSTTQWLVLQAGNTGGVLSWAGDVVTVDPSSTLSTFVPSVIGTNVTGTITIYTR